MKNRRIQVARRRRGTIIILVVAVVALLAIIGTVFIIAARAERAAANAASANVDTVLAEKAAMNTVVEIIGNPNYDSAGNVGGYDAATGKYGNLAARNYDAPDCPPIYFTNPSLSLVNVSTGATAANPSMRGEPWLAPTLHCNGPNDIGSFFAPQTSNGTTFTNGFSGDSYLTYMGFDPTTGSYDYPLNINPMTATTPVHVVTSVNVVNDLTIDAPSPNVNPDGCLTKTALSVTTPIIDAYWNLLPISDASGIRYRYAVRILDTSRMANLNTGATTDDSTGAIGDTTGSYLTSMRLAPTATNGWLSPAPADYFNAADTAANLHVPNLGLGANKGAGRAGTSTTNSTFTLANWQRQIVLQIEKPQDSLVSLFDLSDELELRSYGEYGTSYHARPTLGNGANYTLWPNTLSNNPSSPTSDTVVGNPARRNYTTYSFSRELRPYPDPNLNVANPFTPFTLTPTDSVPVLTAVPTAWTGFGTPVSISTVWPTAPARVAANPDVSSASDNDATFYIAMAATNMATAMLDSGYSADEALAYAANYVTYRTNVMQVDPAIVGATAYNLPSGPSFIDASGICVRSLTSSGLGLLREFGPGTNDLNTSYANLPAAQRGSIYLGYAAQPFINEVVVDALLFTDPISGVKTTVVKDSAVELYNPYSVALSLNDYQIQIDNGPPITLTGYYIPAQGYFVIYNGGGNLNGIVQGTPQKMQAAAFQYPVTGGSKVTLLRHYIPRNHAANTYGPVDTFDYSQLVPPPTDTTATDPTGGLDSGGADTDLSISRKSGDSTWGAAVNISQLPRINAPSLGTVNIAPAVGNKSLQLFDRTCENSWTVANVASIRGQFSNIAALNRVMRCCNEFTTDNTTTVTPLSTKLQSITTSPLPAAIANMPTNRLSTTIEPYEAQIRFDFYPNPKVYSTCPPSNPNNDTDLSAIKFLDHIAMIDRVSDPTINVGGGVLDINKIRLPGQLNINTVSGDVSRAMPGIQLMTNHDQVVANILSYRVRAGVQNTTFTTTTSYNSAPGKDYSTQATYPGVGIRSLAELMIPIEDAVGGSPASLDARDQPWASIYNLCTVRSDTFVVYGYLEALQGLPHSVNDNLSQWYGHGADNAATPAPTDTCIRVARLRWVAIVDRSFCNYAVGSPNFQMPRVVAIRDLPR